MGVESDAGTEPVEKPVVKVTLTFEAPLTKEKLRERCQGIADCVEEME